jgi:hypothetical protein
MNAAVRGGEPIRRNENGPTGSEAPVGPYV